MWIQSSAASGWLCGPFSRLVFGAHLSWGVPLSLFHFVSPCHPLSECLNVPSMCLFLYPFIFLSLSLTWARACTGFLCIPVTPSPWVPVQTAGGWGGEECEEREVNVQSCVGPGWSGQRGMWQPLVGCDLGLGGEHDTERVWGTGGPPSEPSPEGRACGQSAERGGGAVRGRPRG